MQSSYHEIIERGIILNFTESDDKRLALFLKTVRENPYIKQKPTEKQAIFLMKDGLEGFFGGAAGGAKSSGLLMAALQYITFPHYAAIIFRRTYKDLALPGALMDRAYEWLYSNNGAKYDDTEKTWHFPSGATLTFGYLEAENDRFRYQSSEFAFCVAKGTNILMADGTYKKIEIIKKGDMVKTLEGDKPVIQIWGERVTDCVEAIVTDAKNKLIGRQIHPIDHPILTPNGWYSYSDVSRLFEISLSKRCGFSCKQQQQLLHKYLFPSKTSVAPHVSLPLHEQGELPPHHQDCVATCVFSIDNQNCCEVSGDVPLISSMPPMLSVPVVLHVPSPQQESVLSNRCANACGQNCPKPVDSQFYCSFYPHLCDGRFQLHTDNVQDVAPLSNDVDECTLLYCKQDVGAQTPQYTQNHLISYVHPYTNEIRPLSERVVLGSCLMSPIGKHIVYDITVADVHHYVSMSNLVNKNCGFDELSQFSESQYTYLFSRLRRLKDSDIPIRMRAASNPGGVGSEWVKERFISHAKTNPNDPNRFFIPANMYDNPFLDHVEYEKSLENLDPITKAQLKDGNWDISFNSGLFKREWFEFVQSVPRGRTIRCWDMAATEQKDYNDPDWTVGVLMTESQGQYFIKDVVRFRKAPGEAEKLIRQTAEMDGKAVSIYMEQEPGSSGVGMIDHYARYVLQGFPFYGVKASGDKVTRAQGLSAAASHHNVKIYSGVAHISDLLSEFDMFPLGKHDDAVDSASFAYNQLSGGGSPDRFKNMLAKKRRW